MLALLATLLTFRSDFVSLFLSDEVPAGSEPKRTIAQTARTARGDAGPVEQRAGERGEPKFDAIRVDPEGSSVFAGRAPSGAAVTVLANGEPVARTRADEEGQWAIVVDHRFAPGEYQFSLEARPGEGPLLAGQTIPIHVEGAAGAKKPAALEKMSASRQAARLAPVTFIYDEANFTELGRKQAAALAEFLRQRRAETVTLSGHADERGSDLYNMQLSQQRLDAVAHYLREAGYAGKLVLLPMGKREPFAGADRQRLSMEEAFQLDRRVELRESR
jgi:outer membrane protein OmpA-like peptidoglycan-associated protein